MARLIIEDIEFRLPPNRTLFAGVTLSVAVGEFVTIIGANGSGKTTLLKIIAGLLAPSKGNVQTEESGSGIREPSVGIILQNPDHQMIAATVEEEIALALEFRGKPSSVIHKKVDDLIERFSLQELRKRSPESLSGGQKQRVAVAAIMAGEPRFVLFDEPDALLDAPSRKELMSAVSVIRPATGIIWTTPNPSRMPPADRCLFLNRGCLKVFDERELRDE